MLSTNRKKNNADMTGIKLTQQICIELLKSTRNENTTPTNKMSAVNIEVIKRREKELDMDIVGWLTY